MSTCIYPGSFDPIHLGHIDIIKRATKIFDRVIVSPSINKNKKGRFTLDERVEMINICLKDIENNEKIEVLTFDNMLVDFCKNNDINTILKGVRNINDFTLEQDMANAIKLINKDVETLLICSNTQLQSISSSIVLDVALNNGDLTPFVNEEIIFYIENKFGGNKNV